LSVSSRGTAAVGVTRISSSGVNGRRPSVTAASLDGCGDYRPSG
jgi:hypothetical protein